jgi:1-deoxy-D-xylulose-5-phosphate reductoisomerase
MRLPISLALGWPHRIAGAHTPLDFAGATGPTSWTFEPLDDEVFPAVTLARQAVTAGGRMPAVYNAANEEAAVEFLAGTLSFPRIVDTIAAVLDDCSEFDTAPRDLDDVLEAERAARAAAHERMSAWLTR